MSDTKRDLPKGVTDALRAHGTHLSDTDEVEINVRIAHGADIADLALRTCLSGARIDGFDAYWEHLRVALAGEDTTS